MVPPCHRQTRNPAQTISTSCPKNDKRKFSKNVAEKEISSAEEEATRIINEAIKSSENKKREALLEAKEEILKTAANTRERSKSAGPTSEAGAPTAAERRKTSITRWIPSRRKRKALTAKHAAADKAAEEIKNIKHSQMEMLERISGFTADEAKDYLIAQVESGCHPRDCHQDQGDRDPGQGRGRSTGT